MFIISRVVFSLIVWSCILFLLSSVGTQAHTLIPITEISEEEKQRLRNSVFNLKIEIWIVPENCTGFFVKDKAGQVLFVTAFHCLDGGSSYKVIIGDEEAGVEVVGLDGIHDLALLKLKTDLPIPEQSILSLEETAHSLPPQMLYMPGFPSKNHSDSEQKYHLTQGEFKGTRWGVLYEFVTNNSSPKGNSGGPVISSKSQKVVGIVIIGARNLAYFIAIDKLKALMEEEDIECPSLEECVKEERKHMIQEASNGNIQAQDRLGEYYTRPENPNENPKEGVRWFKKSAEQGYAPAQNGLGAWYLKKARKFEKYEDVTELECETKKECEDKAEYWFNLAAEQGYAPAQDNLGWRYVEKAREREAVRWFKKSAEQGYAPAQNNLGLRQECYREGVRWFKKSAEQGYAPAQFNLGLLYLEKSDKFEEYKDVTELECEDWLPCYSEAVRWFKKVAEQENAEVQTYEKQIYLKAQIYLGDLYLNKALEFEEYKDVTELECEDWLSCYIEAVRWFKKSTEQLSTEKNYQLGMYYERKEEVVQAAIWLYFAASRRHEEALTRLYSLATQGKGKVLDWLKVLPQAQAMFFVAEIYESGVGDVDKDVTEAVKWYQKAAEQGYAAAQTHLGKLYLEKSDEESGEFEKYKDVTELECETKKECEDKAEYWFNLAAEQGDPEASNQLIMLINRQIDELQADLADGRYGLAIEGDEEALKGLYSLATQGVSRAFLKLKDLPQAQAMFFVAEIYESGVEDVDKDVTEAVKWYQKAAEKKLADITKNRYKPSPYKRTVTEIKQAAEQGNIQAQYDLGTLYECLEESIQAIYWYKKTFNTSTEWCKANDVQECN